MAVASLSCPSCGSTALQALPNQELASNVITPYRCNSCLRTFESGPFQLPQKANTADPKPKGKTIAA
jgi:hypothetical protein